MTATVDAPAVEEKKPLFGRGEKRAILDPMWDDNPIALQVLGICSALAVTVKLDKSLVMCGAVVFVLCMSNVIISVLRRWIPNKLRIIVMLTVISTLVTLVSLFLEAYLFELSKALSVFVGLIVTNCIVMGRAEAYAMANPPWRSFLDGLGNALGYSWILIAVAVVRELFGSGELMGLRLIPRAWYADQGGWYVDNGLMVLAPGAFILLGIIVWVQRAISGYSEQY
ncbi:MAG: NADH:ubiquinone reductase (Na(+)-transporting) subunit D [Planctomycetota bacterium]|jgi:Na+-transporting NADH:ubiquinone oxidoreductase subunit D